jgi:FixJ family two-component response regulator
MIQIGSHEAYQAMPPSAKPMVYVVDDDAGVLGSLRFLLETDGFAVRTFWSSAAVLNAAPTDADCFVIDYKMPDINGIDLVGKLRNCDITAPVILITGYPDAHISNRAAAAGIKQVLRKPLFDDSLVKQIRRAIQEALTREPTFLRSSSLMSTNSTMALRKSQFFELNYPHKRANVFWLFQKQFGGRGLDA